MTNQLKLIIALVFSLLVLIGLAMTLIKPIEIPTIETALIVEGIVDSVYEGGTNDLNLFLKNDQRYFYVNRGLEKMGSLATLKEQLSGKFVRILYPNQSSILNPNNSTVHISQLELEGQVLFTEIKE